MAASGSESEGEFASAESDTEVRCLVSVCGDYLFGLLGSFPGECEGSGLYCRGPEKQLPG